MFYGDFSPACATASSSRANASPICNCTSATPTSSCSAIVSYGNPSSACARNIWTDCHMKQSLSNCLIWQSVQRMCEKYLAHLLRHVSYRSRSEEHTSELQSLMRISYAVFCLENINNMY